MLCFCEINIIKNLKIYLFIEVFNYQDIEDFIYDEFGFKIDENEISVFENDNWQSFIDVNLSQLSSLQQLNEKLFIEDSKHKLKWIAYLEFTLNADIGQSFSWSDVTQLNRCEKLRQMIRGQGIKAYFFVNLQIIL